MLLLKVSRSGINQLSLNCLLGHCKTEAGTNRKKVKKTAVKGIRQMDFVFFFFLPFCNSIF